VTTGFPRKGKGVSWGQGHHGWARWSPSRLRSVAGRAPPLPATRLPSWTCPASRSVRTPRLAALWFAAPSLPFLRLRGLRYGTPSGAMAPAAPTGLDVPAGYDPAAFAAASGGRCGHLPGVPSPYSGHDLPESVHARSSRPPAPSVHGVSHALDGLLLQQAPGPFQAGAAPGVLPTEPCSSSGSRAPLGAVTLLPFLATTVLHSEVFWKIMVLRSCRVLLHPTSPYPAGLPPR
jgi:hypothetical protein